MSPATNKRLIKIGGVAGAITVLTLLTALIFDKLGPNPNLIRYVLVWLWNLSLPVFFFCFFIFGLFARYVSFIGKPILRAAKSPGADFFTRNYAAQIKLTKAIGIWVEDENEQNPKVQ